LDRDRLINLLPEEYLPEPEFKAFPVFAAGLIILTLLFVWINLQKDQTLMAGLQKQRDDLAAENVRKVDEAKEFTDIAANARFIASYIAVIPEMVLQAPDYWEIYNEVERLLPEDTWLTSLTFRNRPNGWPDVIVNCVSRGYGYSGPLNTYDKIKGTPEDMTRFENIKMGGYQRINLGGAPGVGFTIQMSVRYPLE
jgi:hypothetical protein